MTGQLRDVPVERLRPNPNNPRAKLGDLTELTESVREVGVLQPLIASYSKTSGLTVLAGHRRLAAAKRAGMTTVPVVIVGEKLDDDQLVIALHENTHREPLAPTDEARACGALIRMGRSRSEIAFELNHSGNWVADRLALLALPTEMQRDVDEGRITIGKAAQVGHLIRKRSSGSVTLNARAPYHFTRTHDLAEQAKASCDEAEHPSLGRVGPACGSCWENVIRQDERQSAMRVAS